jgi:pimeloyl-ACP methyl ester carboxylesterase
MPLWRFLRIVLGGPEASIFDLPRILRGMQFSQRTMWAEVSSLDLTTAAPALQMPVFFFLGRHDHVIAAETSAAYFEGLAAPSKRLVWFEESAHEPPFEEPFKFNQAIVELLKPVLGIVPPSSGTRRRWEAEQSRNVTAMRRGTKRPWCSS